MYGEEIRRGRGLTTSHSIEPAKLPEEAALLEPRTISARSSSACLAQTVRRTGCGEVSGNFFYVFAAIAFELSERVDISQVVEVEVSGQVHMHNVSAKYIIQRILSLDTLPRVSGFLPSASAGYWHFPSSDA